MWTLPAISFAVYAVLYAMAEIVSKKTKGIFSSLLFLSLAYLIGFLSGVFPKDCVSATGMPGIVSAFVSLAIVTNMGTLISLRQLAREWKTVVICLSGVAALAAFCLLTDGKIFAPFYGLCTLPAIPGGIVALAIIKDALVSCDPCLTAFTLLLFALHNLVGIPLASYMLRAYCKSSVPPAVSAAAAPAERKLTVLSAREDESPALLLARLACVMALAAILSHFINDAVPASVFGLVLGVFAAELGFLPRDLLSKAGHYNLLIFMMLTTVVDPMALVDLPSLIDCLAPLLFYLLCGSAVTILGSVLAGGLLKVDWRLSCALSCACMIGFPGTLIVAQDIVDGIGYEDEAQRLAMRNALGSKMVIAGFSTVSTASVIIASLIAPLLG